MFCCYIWFGMVFHSLDKVTDKGHFSPSNTSNPNLPPNFKDWCNKISFPKIW